MILGFGAAGVVWVAAYPEPFWSPGGRFFIGLASAAMAIAGPLGAVATFRTATLLFADRVASRGFRTQFLRRSEISGLRSVDGQYGVSTLRLFTGQPGGKSMSIGLYRPDEAFVKWFEGVPDLDQQDYDAAEREALADPRLGDTAKGRSARLQGAKAQVRWLNAFGWAVMAWTFFWPRPYELAVLAAALCPLIGVVMVVASRGALTLFDGGPRASVSGLLWTGMALGLRAMLDIEVIDWQMSLGLSVGFGLAVALAAARWIDPIALARPLVVAAFAIPAALYGWGVLGEANTLLDRSEAQVFRLEVLGKRISSGKHTEYELDLPAWGPLREPGEVDVGRALYDQVKVGDTVCGYLHPGILRMRWYAIGHCTET